MFKSQQIKKPYSYIEPAIRPLVDMLNSVNAVRTIASCEGHTNGKPPYVYFKAPLYFASCLEKVLRDDSESGLPLLSSQWVVVGRFDGSFELTYSLHSPEYFQISYDNFGMSAWWLFGIRRRRLDKEILALAEYVKQASCLNIWNCHKPNIPNHAKHDDRNGDNT